MAAQDVKSFAAGMKQSIMDLKKAMANAKAGLDSEISHAQTNAEKVVSFTAELKSANLEVDDFLGETGSNFPPADGTSDTQPVSSGPDRNGVTVLKK